MKLSQESKGQRCLALALLVLVAVAALALPACSRESESQRQKGGLTDEWNAHVAYWNSVLDEHNQFIEDYNRAMAKADKAKTGLNAPTDYPKDLMDAVEAYTGKRATASEWNQFSRAVVDYVNIAMHTMIFYKNAGPIYDRASQRLSSTVAPPERLVDAHRALVQAERKAGRILTRAAKQIDKAMKMNNPNSASIFFGEGKRIYQRAIAAATAADKRETKAWKAWKRAMNAEEKRLRSEASRHGETLPD
jgi:hypothetical protein